MTRPAPLATPQPTGAWPLYRALVGVGLVCALLIVLVYQGTLPRIAANRLAARQAAIFDVLPGATQSTTFQAGADGYRAVAPDSTGQDLVFAGYDETGALVGIAIETGAMGYQDIVRVLYGYAPDRQAIVGMRVLESRETPGLGDRVETDPGFLANFQALDVRLAADRASLAHPLQAVGQGQKTEPWQVDCITGATITSKAIANMLRDSAASQVPRIAGSLDDFDQREIRP